MVPTKQVKHNEPNHEIYDLDRHNQKKHHREFFVMYHHKQEDILGEKSHGKMSLQYL
jgi:hypothetical protein